MSTSSTTELYHNVPSAVVDVGAFPDIDDAAKLTTAQLVILLAGTNPINAKARLYQLF